MLSFQFSTFWSRISNILIKLNYLINLLVFSTMLRFQFFYIFVQFLFTFLYIIKEISFIFIKINCTFSAWDIIYPLCEFAMLFATYGWSFNVCNDKWILSLARLTHTFSHIFQSLTAQLETPSSETILGNNRPVLLGTNMTRLSGTHLNT